MEHTKNQMDVVEFFKQSAGRWSSCRTTHHLAFRRAEVGDSHILVKSLSAEDPQIRELCEFHSIDPNLSVGGSQVEWLGSMAWDREGEENHKGTTVFAIVPDADDPLRGRLLRERGYAEIVPVVGQYHLDAEGGLVLTTEYETMSSIERFWFVGPNLRMRTSTVKRFGGFSTASFCSEVRLPDAQPADAPTDSATDRPATGNLLPMGSGSVLGW
jgi:hypothetical protein